MPRSVRLLLILAALALGVAVGYVTDPECRLKGLLRGEGRVLGRYDSAWLRDLRGDETQRTAAMTKLLEAKADALPLIQQLAQVDQPTSVRLAAVEILTKLGPDARPATSTLIFLLRDDDPQVRKLAAVALGKLAPEAPGAVPALIEAFPMIEALRAVAAFQAAGADAVPRLTQLLTHEDVAIRWNAARTLGKIGEASLPALPEILKHFLDADPAVREHAAEAVGDLGPKAASAIPELVRLLKDPDAKVRKDSVRALGQMGAAAKSVLTEVAAMKNDPDPLVQQYATTAERLIEPSRAGASNDGQRSKP